VAQLRPFVRKIRPGDAGYGSEAFREFPWLCFPCRRAPYPHAFRTSSLANDYGRRLAAGLTTAVR
jgi:hypothetical protein